MSRDPSARHDEPLWIAGVVVFLVVALVALRWLPFGEEAPALPVPVAEADIAQPHGDGRTTDTSHPTEDVGPRDVRTPDTTEDEASLVLTVTPAEATAGQQIEVVVLGRGPIKELSFVPPDGIAVQNRSSTTQINIVGALIHRKLEHTVVVSTDSAGEYTLGPASAQLLEGGRIESNTVMLRISGQ